MTAPAADLKSIFGKALELSSAADRAAYLKEACGGNEALRAEIEALLQALERAGAFMKPPRDIQTIDEPAVHSAGTVIGPYRLLQKLGEGGMGEVWVAAQEQPVKRRVALKVIKPGMDSVQVIHRFEAERQALALMDHTNIAKVLDAGTIGGPAVLRHGIGERRPAHEIL